nr:unnamed protein product [Trichobilharzia regenti]
MLLPKDEFEESSSQSLSQDSSYYWGSLRSIWRQMDREDTITNPNSSSEKENHHIDNLRLNVLLSDVNESIDYLTASLSTLGGAMESSKQKDTIGTAVKLVKQISYEREILSKKQPHLINSLDRVKNLQKSVSERMDRLLSNIESSLADEVASCNSLSTDSFEKLKQSVELYRNSFKKVSPANKSHETKSRQTQSDVKFFKKDEEKKPESSDIWAETNQHISRTPVNSMLTSLNSAVSVHMKFRTPHSSTNRKPNVRTVQRLPYSIQAQIVKKESPDSYNIRTTAKCLQRGSSSCQRKASRYIPSPDETPDSSDCISLSSIIDL